MAEFVHLHLHTEWSLLDGALRVSDVVRKAIEYKMPAVAITDHGNLFGVIHFYEKMREAGLKPLIGCEFYVAPGSRFEKKAKSAHEAGYHLVLLAENEIGYRNLCRLATKAHFEGFYWKPRIDKELLKEHHEGLLALTACLHGEVPAAILSGNLDRARELIETYSAIFPGRFYLEIQENGLADQRRVNEVLLEMGESLGLPVVATNDCHFLSPEDAFVHEVLLCIQTGKTLNDPNRFRFETDQVYFASPEEMAARFRDYPPEVLTRTLEIAERIHLELPLGEHHFPVYPLPQGKTYEEVFEEAARRGLEERLAELKAGPGLAAPEAEYRERLDYEIEVITKKGFASYFLIVADFIAWARRHGIPVGPGRGSAAGSLVAYAMRITNLDPLRYGLLFERFLNAERASLPDIDVDFCMQRRDEVIEYVREKYGGQEYVAQIATFGQLKARAVVRDVGRALGFKPKEIDPIAKLIPEGPNVKLEEALSAEPRLRELAEKDERVARLFAIARALEGLPRHSSTHAAGVVIADRPLTDYLPLMKGEHGEIITQFDMKAVEKIGLIKFDFLGLKTLTILDQAVKLVREHYGKEIDLDHLPLDDEKTFELLRRADTDGVFQLESSGMKDLLRRLQPTDFNDLIAVLALYRPGPLESGMVEQYIEVKHGRRKPDYLHPKLEPILRETYGVILYQEQVMKIAQELAGYTLGEADILRKAMGKKIPEVMAQQRARFVSGAVERGIPRELAEHIFDLMEKFAGYGFNKSHSAAYALVAYQTAYLKAHYPLCYMAALLSYEMGKAEEVMKYVAVCRKMGIEVRPPDVNASGVAFTIEGEALRYGLAAIKNVGAGAVEEIVAEREEKGPFRSLADFCVRVDPGKVNRRVLEALIKAGAFDRLEPNRAKLLENLEAVMDWAQKEREARARGQISIFDLNKERSSGEGPVLQEVPDWSPEERLFREREALGFYLTGHPLSAFRDWLSVITPYSISNLREAPEGRKILVGAALGTIKTKTTRRGEKMAFVQLEDGESVVEALVFPEVYARALSFLEEGRLVLARGTVEKATEEVRLLVEDLRPLSQAAEALSGRLVLTLDAEGLDRRPLETLRELLSQAHGPCEVQLELRFPEGVVRVDLNGTLRVKVSPELVRETRRFLGEKLVALRLEA
ncbi:DNA polymerase III subunit alpha [Thermosulfurimonas marina]|uniref:DNA polymerase III subunit alpha n=1 Tax=Thermosulfurimonas marina TaxID=2047767 RepID=A0A6H1WT39_9BACT|nr:DNA polymerase III subunit alpha [Thermosulfurimonas marina]QJA06319.1 DNA polymerase III subunit alpha [Thermosulfurimonas marina]